MIKPREAEATVAVHVTERDGIGMVAAAGDGAGGETAETVADEHADVIARTIGGDDVELAVAV